MCIKWHVHFIIGLVCSVIVLRWWNCVYIVWSWKESCKLCLWNPHPNLIDPFSVGVLITFQHYQLPAKDISIFCFVLILSPNGLSYSPWKVGQAVKCGVFCMDNCLLGLGCHCSCVVTVVENFLVLLNVSVWILVYKLLGQVYRIHKLMVRRSVMLGLSKEPLK